MKTRGRIDSHVRAAVVRRMGDVSEFIKEFKHRFSRWYNKTYQRFGTLWAERYTSVLVEDVGNSVKTVAACIDLNPVRAGLVQDPKEHRFWG